MIAPGDHHLPVFARVRVDDRCNLRSRDRLPWIAKQCLVQFSLRGTRLGRRHEFRARQIDFQEFVGNKQLACGIAVKQMTTAGEPEVARSTQRCAPFSSPARSRCSAGTSSSPTTSKNSKASVCPAPSRERSVRNCSRMVPFSWLRVTATSTPGEWSQSDATKPISSSAARLAAARSGAPKYLTSCAASISITARRSFSFVSTICASVERPSESNPKKPARNAARALPPQICRVAMGKCESPRHCPFTRLCGLFKNERIRPIEPDGPQQLHRLSPVSCFSIQAVYTFLRVPASCRCDWKTKSGLQEIVRAMADPPRHLLICSCDDTMPLDAVAVRHGCRPDDRDPAMPRRARSVPHHRGERHATHRRMHPRSSSVLRGGGGSWADKAGRIRQYPRVRRMVQRSRPDGSKNGGAAGGGGRAHADCAGRQIGERRRHPHLRPR